MPYAASCAIIVLHSMAEGFQSTDTRDGYTSLEDFKRHGVPDHVHISVATTRKTDLSTNSGIHTVEAHVLGRQRKGHGALQNVLIVSTPSALGYSVRPCCTETSPLLLLGAETMAPQSHIGQLLKRSNVSVALSHDEPATLPFINVSMLQGFRLDGALLTVEGKTRDMLSLAACLAKLNTTVVHSW